MHRSGSFHSLGCSSDQPNPPKSEIFLLLGVLLQCHGNCGTSKGSCWSRCEEFPLLCLRCCDCLTLQSTSTAPKHSTETSPPPNSAQSLFVQSPGDWTLVGVFSCLPLHLVKQMPNLLKSKLLEIFTVETSSKRRIVKTLIPCIPVY